jgi:hypothetical protein
MGFHSSNPSFIASLPDEERSMRHSLAFALALIAAPLAAQQTARTIAPGMTKAQVVTALGQPATARTVSEYTYLFYINSCGKRCGMNDLVVLHGDSVVDAIFRSPSRHYTGTSSSPAEATPVMASRHAEPAAASKPAAVVTKPAATTTVAKPAATTTAKPAATTAAAKPAPAVEKPAAPAIATAKAAVTPEPPDTVFTKGTKTNVEVRGTKREVVIPGTKTEAVAPGGKLTPAPANDIRPSIPISPPILTNPTPPTSTTTPAS